MKLKQALATLQRYNVTTFQRLKAQALVEMALLGLFPALMLAAAVDFGRAYYTAAIVTNMAGEGAAYAALYPDQDLSDQNCSLLPVQLNRSIQERARRVAKDHGLVINRNDQDAATIEVTTLGFGGDCRDRCTSRTITVRVTYTLNDLFLPGLIGLSNIPITKSATQLIERNPQTSGLCP